MKKRLLSILLAAFLLLGLLPTVALAEGKTGSEPSVCAYATKAQLTDGTFSPNYNGTPTNLGKLTFGQRSGTPLEWYILGKGAGTDDTVIFAATPIGTNIKFSNSSGGTTLGEKVYQTSWGCTYTSPSPPTSVYLNHYGGSNLRDYLKLAASDMYNYFTEAELSMMNDTTLSLVDTKNDVEVGNHYTITDKLFSLSKYENGLLMVGGLGATKFVAREYYWNHGDPFWLCTPYTA